MNLLEKPFLLSQLIVAILSGYFLIKKRTQFLKLLTLFLVVTFLIELLGGYLSSIKQKNFWVYHFYNIFQYIIIYYLYQGILKEKKYLKISYLLLFVVAIIWIITFIDKSYFFYISIIGSLNVGILVFLYLRELLMSDKIINYSNLLSFWISIGFLVFYLPAIPFFSFWLYLRNRDLFSILTSLIILMNIIISFGLIWSNIKEVKY